MGTNSTSLTFLLAFLHIQLSLAAAGDGSARSEKLPCCVPIFALQLPWSGLGAAVRGAIRESSALFPFLCVGTFTRNVQKENSNSVFTGKYLPTVGSYPAMGSYPAISGGGCVKHQF